ncbi:unnamed protein product [Paramecium sonneborni]|uniref:Transmembrane protein n=1 Tax=Paramecium sonneborni TaxID=65129 RepID=A0A8S1LQ37_9CILI|nr:unnamed protein product [Paramecium sonneborni]
MNRIIDSIQKLDIFGVPVTLLTNENEQKFKSKFGGFLSLIAGSTSLVYFFYIMILWINNEISPNVSSKQKTTGYSEFKWSDRLITFNLFDFSSQIDPFRKENNIITPLLFTVVQSRIEEQPLQLFSTEENPGQFVVNEGSLILNNAFDKDEIHQEMRQYLLVFATCTDDFKMDGKYCADNQVMEEYLKTDHGFLFLTIKLHQLNYVTRELESFEKQQYVAFDPQETLYTQIILKQQETIIDDGILFEKLKKYFFLNNYEITNQPINSDFMPSQIQILSQGQYKLKAINSYLFRIDNISIVENVIMPKLGQILASIGSIVQLIFILQYVAVLYNKQLFENYLTHDIITMYYPDFKSVQLNWLNQISFNEKDNQKFNYPIQNLNQAYKALQKGAKQKCRLNNVLYEISRLQFVFQQQLGNSIFQACHSLGGIMSNNLFESFSMKETNRMIVYPFDSLEQEFKQIVQVEPLELLIKQN